MELLILLVEKQGLLVTREEIVSRLWPKDTFLDTETSINSAIRKIRVALHDDSEDPRYLQTVVGKGYRFIAPIEVIGAPAAAASESPAAVFRPKCWLRHCRKNSRGTTRGGGVRGLIAAFLAGVVWHPALAPAPVKPRRS